MSENVGNQIPSDATSHPEELIPQESKVLSIYTMKT